MKKMFFVLLLVGVMMVLTVSLASANNGPHGGYTPTDDACAGCHRAHTGDGAGLLVAADTTTLCLTCHGNTATGAVTNVTDGVLEATAGTNAGTPLNGGGFGNVVNVVTGLSATSTSSHEMTGVAASAWGFGVNRGVAGALVDTTFDCATCHDPHGSTNYRIIKENLNGVPTTVTQVDEGVWDYDAEAWPADMSNVCSACHDAYHQTTAGQGSILDAGTYTHRVDMSYLYGTNSNPETIGFGTTECNGVPCTLPLGGTDLVVCSTCHFSHGTSAAMTGFADGGPSGAGTLPGNTTASDSALLRLDNRGVCETCHQK
jgi:predicted CXXCH cytochrome family protein